MAAKEPVMESAFSFRLWPSLLLIELHAFTINGSEGVGWSLFLASDFDELW